MKWREMVRNVYKMAKGLYILPVSSKQAVVSRDFLELYSMTGTVETVFASSIARYDAIWAIYCHTLAPTQLSWPVLDLA